MKKIAVILSGCGVYDGSEIYESVITLLAIDSHDASYQCFAPNIPQMHVVNHLTGEVVENESRNVLIEAARLARGNIKDLTELQVEDYDAVIFPGGFGAAKNLSSFAIHGADMNINAEVQRVAEAFANAGKPAGYVCIAPTLVAKIYGRQVKCTVGCDEATASAINQMGGKHIECKVDDVVIDTDFKVITTPAYMLANRISDAAAGIEKLVQNVLNLCE